MGGVLVALPVRVPHFDLPFRFVNGSVAVVDQDTEDDIANCVEAILRTPYGYRTQDGIVDFGNHDPLFEIQPVDIELIKSTIESQEPRSHILTDEETDRLDALISHVMVEVS